MKIRLAILSTALSLVPASIFADCAATVDMEAKSGVGGDGKIGWTQTCGSDCETHYFRMKDFTSSITFDYEETSDPFFGINYTIHQTVCDGTNIQLRKKTTPGACSSSYTTVSGYKHVDEWTESNGDCSNWGRITSTDNMTYTSEGGPAFPYCGVIPETGWINYEYNETDSCGVASYVHEGWIFYGPLTYHSKQKNTGTGTYSDEYTTGEMKSNAKSCAELAFSSAMFSAGTPAQSLYTLNGDSSTAGVTKTKWRLKIVGAPKGQEYKVKITTTTEIKEQGAEVTERDVSTQEESWTASGDLVAYYPSEDGREIELKEGSSCGYTSTVSVSADLVPKDDQGCCCSQGTAASAPGSSAASTPSRAAASAPSSATPNATAAGASYFDNSTIARVGLGSGLTTPSLGSLVIRSAKGTSTLASRGSVTFDADPALPELEVIYASDGISQVVTPKLFVNISSNSATSTTIRVMTVGAQGTWNGSSYDYDGSDTYLIRQYAVENPDGTSATNRVRVREFSGSFTNEWMYTYTSTNSGWNVTLPDGSGSVDLVSTNHAATAYTLIKRFRNAAGTIIEQRSQIYTNFSWGYTLLQETSGVGADVRTRSLAYYTGMPSAAPFTPTPSRLPLQSAAEEDGSWRYILQYTSNARVQTELRGIDSGLTTNTNLCLRIESTYISQDASDDLSREPDKPRKVEEWWKGVLIRRTYHIYTSNSHKTIECPNPTNAITDTSNLITQVIYVDGTMDVIRTIHPDTTIEKISWFGNTQQIDVGQDDGFGYVANGTRTQITRSDIGTVQSIKSWDMVGGSQGVQTRDSVWSNFDYADRPQTLTEWGSGTSVGTTTLTTTMTYDCCGLATVTDPDGLVTSYGHDPNHRLTTVTQWSVSDFKVFDAAGRIWQNWRIGTDSSAILRRGLTYDTTGFLTAQTNALNGITSSTRSKLGSGFDQIATTNPDAGTSTQTYLGDRRGDKLTGTAVAPVRYVYGTASSITYLGSSRTLYYEKSIKLDASGNDTTETEITYFDGIGRQVIRELPGSAQYVTEYNALGQKVRDIDPDGVWTLYRYDAKGQLVVTAIDVDHDQHVANYDSGYSGSDRVTQNVTYYLAASDGANPRGVDVRIDEQSVWTTASSAATALTSRIETLTDGLTAWRSVYKDQSTPVTTTIQTVYGSGGSRTRTTTAPTLVKQIVTYSSGRPITITEKDSANAQIVKTDIAYDTHGRRYTSTDARNGATTFLYNNADQIASTTTPIPGNGQPAQTTSTLYDASLRAWIVTYPDGKTMTNEYNALGLLQKTYGARRYPVSYTYDPQGRMKTMTTWQNYAGNSGTATTTWNYDANRGWLNNQRYNDNTGPDYTYTPGERLQTRTWARTGTGGNRVVTTYTYGLISGSWHGDMTGITYTYDPQSAPAVTFTYDRRGRRATMSSSTDAITYTYNDADMVTQDTHGAGTLNGYNVTWTFNANLQFTGLGANTPTAISQSFTYKNSGLLDTATDGAYNAAYSYISNSKLVSQILYKNSTTTRLTTTKQWDFLNRLTETKSAPSGSGELASDYRYNYNNVNQRVTCTLGDGSYWEYQYDYIGEVISGKHFWGDGTPVAGQQFEYGFSDIGNRTTSKFGGDASGQNLQTVTYTTNLLNQYTQRTVPAVAPVVGIAASAATVTVNSASVYRKGEYFWKETAVSNGSLPVWQSLSIQAVNGVNSTTVTGNEFVAKTPEVYSYDADGNLTQDGRWTYSWDAENRLVTMISATSTGPQQKLAFTYDPMGRRIRKQVWNNTSGTGTAATDIKFLYEEWNLIAEMDGLNSNAILRTYLWGTDISGSRQGVGGVGGLLAEKNATTVAQFVVFDGNGNVSRLIAGDAGTTSASYEYGPFGENIRASGSYAAPNPIRFSTKFRDSESDLVYYGYRFYATSTGRWLNRDPLGESAGNNLYRLLNNQAISSLDVLGLNMYPCAPNFKPGLQVEISYRKGKYDVPYSTFVPIPKFPSKDPSTLKKIWKKIKEEKEKIEIAKGLIGEEYLHYEKEACVPICFVSTSISIVKMGKVDMDLDPDNDQTFSFVIFWSIETHYTWHSPGYNDGPPCSTCNRNVNVIPPLPL